MFLYDFSYSLAKLGELVTFYEAQLGEKPSSSVRYAAESKAIKTLFDTLSSLVFTKLPATETFYKL